MTVKVKSSSYELDAADGVPLQTDLTGAGTMSLRTQTTSIRVSVLSLPVSYSVGRAVPQNYYDLGLLRFCDSGSCYPAFPIDGFDIIAQVPQGVTTLGYSLFGSTSVRLTEEP